MDGSILKHLCGKRIKVTRSHVHSPGFVLDRNVLSVYLSELPDYTGRPDFPIMRTVSHPNEGLSLVYFSAQLCHRVKSDLLLGCVFEVLQENGDLVVWFMYFKQPNRKSRLTDKLNLYFVFSSFSTSFPLSHCNQKAFQ